MNPTAPGISVILLAHDRTRFVLAALRSITENSPVASGNVEIVLVKTFVDETIDRAVRALGARVIQSESLGLGGKLADGLAATHGEVILPLEDDDLFSSGKIAEVQRRFREQPSLGYYHNSHIVIDEDGTEVPGRTFRWRARKRIAQLGSVYIRGGRDPRSLRSLAGIHPEFNNSSIAFRRELIRARATHLKRIQLAVDEFLFFCALDSEYSLLVDCAPLTRFRIHSGNVSLGATNFLEPSRRRLQELSEQNVRDLEVVIEMLGDSKRQAVRQIAEAELGVQSSIRLLRGVRRERRLMVKSLRRIVHQRGNFIYRTYRGLLGLGGLYLVSPSASRWLYGRFAPGTH